MSMDYYLKDGTHIGYHASGWKFLFIYYNFKSIEDLKNFLRDKTIINGLYEIISFEDFWNMVESFQNDKSHNEIEKDGYDFMSNEYASNLDIHPKFVAKDVLSYEIVEKIVNNEFTIENDKLTIDISDIKEFIMKE